MNDWELLTEYLQGGSQEAFAALVERYAGLVYSTCLREVKDQALAEDATQVVFLVLLRKAQTIRPGTVLAGWLFNTARFVSKDALRQERRRRQREQKAAEAMVSEMRTHGQEVSWQEIEPLLHEALARLGQDDRNAVLLRYFEGKSLKQTGQAMGVSEDAARQRVNRAVEKLRRYFAQHGYAVAAAVLVGLIYDNAVQAAPAPCLASLLQMGAPLGGGAGTAVAGGSSLTGGAHPGLTTGLTTHVTSVRVVSLAQGVSKMMVFSSIKAGAMVCVALTAGTLGAGKLAHLALAGTQPLARPVHPVVQPRETQPSTAPLARRFAPLAAHKSRLAGAGSVAIKAAATAVPVTTPSVTTPPVTATVPRAPVVRADAGRAPLQRFRNAVVHPTKSGNPPASHVAGPTAATGQARVRLAAAPAADAATEAATHLIFNGDFEQLDGAGHPLGWTTDPLHARVLEENGNHFLRLTNTDPKAFVLATSQMKIAPNLKLVKVRLRMRTRDLQPGAGAWETAHLEIITFQGADKALGYNLIAPPPGSVDWRTVELIVRVPDGATAIQLAPALMRTTGTADFDDIQLIPNPPLSTLMLQPGFPQGNFEQLNPDGTPVGWHYSDPQRVSVVEEAGNHFLRVTNDNAKSQVLATGYFKLDPEWKGVQISVRLRATGLKPGPVSWMNARLSYNYANALGDRIGGWPQTADVRADTDWKTMTVRSAIPAGTAYLRFDATLQECLGTLDVDDIDVQPLETTEGAPGLIVRVADKPLKPQPGNLITAGAFERVDAQGQAAAWELSDPGRVRIMEEDGNHFLRVTSARAGGTVGARCTVPLDPAWQKLVVRARMRAAGLRLGGNAGEQAQVGVEFADAAGRRLGTRQEVPALKHESDWVVLESTVYIPAGAVSATIKPEIVNSVGQVDFDDIQVVGQKVIPSPDLLANALTIRTGEPSETFETAPGGGLPLGWKSSDPRHSSVVQENGNHFLRVTNDNPHGLVTVDGSYELDPAWKSVTVRVRMRARNLQVGQHPWETGRLGYIFVDAAGEQAGGYPACPTLNADTDWVTLTQKSDVPTGAVYLKLSAQLLNAAGILDVDDISIEGAR